MKKDTSGLAMLDLLMRPGFCVQDGKILQVNPEAKALLLTPGMDIFPMLLTGKTEYKEFHGGCLYLQLYHSGKILGATVTRIKKQDIFLLDSVWENGALQALSLAARELRTPLSRVLLATEQLSQSSNLDPEQVARLDQGLHQLLRIIGNMSDAGTHLPPTQNLEDTGQVFWEILEKAKTHLSEAGVTLSYTGPGPNVFAMMDRKMMERAVLNLLSNAVKFSPAGSSIQVSAKARGKLLRFSVQDPGSGMGQDVLENPFQRYLRQPGIENTPMGLGLGMVLIRDAASSHGGTVLIDQPRGKGTRVTMTMCLFGAGDYLPLRSPIIVPDYSGGWDTSLVELSDCLPASAFRKN